MQAVVPGRSPVQRDEGGVNAIAMRMRTVGKLNIPLWIFTPRMKPVRDIHAAAHFHDEDESPAHAAAAGSELGDFPWQAERPALSSSPPA